MAHTHQRTHFRPVLFIVLLLAIPITVILVNHTTRVEQQMTERSPFIQNTLYLSPASKILLSGSEFTVALRVRTNRDINALQANLLYPNDTLTIIGITYTNSPFDIQAEETNLPGVLRIARGVIKPVIGDNLIATITFQVKEISSSSHAKITFGKGTAVVESTNSTDILKTPQNSDYFLLAAR